ncbi:hypothetical protein SAMN02745196_00857 [Clostridium collagenovorans DSM 3089]|uniref:Uncharacterized protein n=1 Tax=Clostridium collagenovorans DSM 3089 TaxID=1121306 RepID=A0A1M5U601_9CLOT|nr:hypothetical protein [Clostridium collagenovorans]SHH58368.1 hypothetical protein SAMN02745196_00857 [Clostridium collagenovorans DSM 3089]
MYKLLGVVLAAIMGALMIAFDSFFSLGQWGMTTITLIGIIISFILMFRFNNECLKRQEK